MRLPEEGAWDLKTETGKNPALEKAIGKEFSEDRKPGVKHERLLARHEPCVTEVSEE